MKDDDTKLLNDKFFDDLGMDLSVDKKEKLNEYANNELWERIINQIVKELSDDQVKELTKIKSIVTDEELGDWLEKNVTDLEDIVEEEIAMLLGEIAENSDKF